MNEHKYHYLTRVWHMNTIHESKRLKDIMNRNGFSITLEEARDIIIKFFDSPKTQELVKSGNFPISTQFYTANMRQETVIDPRYIVAVAKDFHCVDLGNSDKAYQFTIVVTNKDYYETLDSCRLKLNYGLYNQENQEILVAFIGIEGIN